MKSVIPEYLRQWRKNWPCLGGALLLATLFVMVFWSGIVSAVAIWYESEIFNHCFFVIPGAIYLIYLKRQALQACQIKPNLLLLIPIAGFLVLYALGLAGSVQLFQHVAIFCSLPLFIWLLLGNKCARILMFPLAFILFSIPVGQELTPWLQQVTADLGVKLLSLSGIPVFRTGLFIEVPGGRFLVAEACSGISFFIASIVIGCLYAHLNIVSLPKKLVFIGISIIYPIIANAVRVYGIIVIAYTSDMKYAVGADHLIYGGIFFALVVVSLLMIGELFRRGPTQTAVSTATDHPPPIERSGMLRGMLISGLTLAAFGGWYLVISQHFTYQPDERLSLNLAGLDGIQTQTSANDWSPQFPDNELEWKGRVPAASAQATDVYLAYFVEGKGELISSLNQLYFQEAWTVVSTDEVALTTDSAAPAIYFEVLSNANGELRYLASWYVIGDKTFASQRNAKLYQIFLAVTGRNIDGGVIAVSRKISEQNTATKGLFIQDVQQLFSQLSAALPQENSDSSDQAQSGTH